MLQEIDVPHFAASLNLLGRTFSVVLNEASGSLIGRSGVTEEVRVAFGHHGVIPIFISGSIGDLPARQRRARDSGAGCVVVAGGDGTVACAAQVLVS